MGKGNKAKRGTNLGKAVIRSRKTVTNPHRTNTNLDYFTTDFEEDERSLSSITQSNDLEEFLEVANLSGREFVAEKQNTIVLSRDSYKPDEKFQQNIEIASWNSLVIPRRPPWKKEMSASLINQNEKTAFLEWRRSLAAIEEEQKLIITPFEKNLEVWRQLWRVLERSNIVVQIVDGRNPLLFRSLDLEDYVTKSGATNIFLVNKSDMLTKSQRKYWSNYFKKEKVNYIFWSAHLAEETEKEKKDLEKNIEEESDLDLNLNKNVNMDVDINNNDDLEFLESNDEYIENQDKKNENKEGGDTRNEDDNSIEDNENDVNNQEDQENIENEDPVRISKMDIEEDFDEDTRIYTKNDLFKYLLTISPPKMDQHKNVVRTVVGFVGYPNVGKSSTINVLHGEKKVSVSSTPGKTKHFQTLLIGKYLTLCDCPGLVFPTFMSSKADMVCNGILPIDELKEWQSPTAIVCNRIRRSTLENLYGIFLPFPLEHEEQDRPPTASELLDAYAQNRGFFTAHGLPDQSRAARYILKDFITGKLVYCYPPPKIQDKDFNIHFDEEVSKRNRPPPETEKKKKETKLSTKIGDTNFVLLDSQKQAFGNNGKNQNSKKNHKKAPRKKRHGNQTPYENTEFVQFNVKTANPGHKQ